MSRKFSKSLLDAAPPQVSDHVQVYTDGSSSGAGEQLNQSIRDWLTGQKRVRQELAQLDAAVAASEDAIFSQTLDGTIESWNAAAEEMYGYTEQEVLGRHISMLLPMDLHFEWQAIFSEFRQGKCVRQFRTKRLCKSGQVEDVSLTLFPMKDRSGAVVGAAVMARAASEWSVRQSEEWLRLIHRTAPDAIITLGHEGIIRGLNPAAENMFGWRASEAIGKHLGTLLECPLDDAPLWHQLTSVVEPTDNTHRLTAVRRDGSTIPIGLALSEVVELGLYTGIVHDHSDLRELQRQVLEIAAEEDRRIGSELHDDVQQQLTGLGLLAQSLAEGLASESAAESDLARRLALGIHQLAEQVQLLARGLVPKQIDAGQFQHALRTMTESIAQQSGIPCCYIAKTAVCPSDDFVATHLYRIAQEAVNNAVKSSRAKQITITLTERDRQLVISIRDDGIGFNRDRDTDGMGLSTMSYRASLVGGLLSIETGAGEGTLVTCRVPNLPSLNETNRPSRSRDVFMANHLGVVE